jgi:hypothetical protein
MEEEKDTLSEQRVFSITHAEISKTAITQCRKHKWEKLNDNEIYCPVCQSAAIVNPEVLDSYIWEKIK